MAAQSVKKEKRASISRLLKELIKKPPDGQPMSYGQLVRRLGDQAFGLVTILFALPSALPISAIPGFSFVFGLPIVFVAVHLIIGKPVLWLPKSLSERTIDLKKLAHVIRKTLPSLLYVERFLKPRWPFFSTPIMERVHGLFLLFLSLLLLLPIPFSNFIFAALIIFFGLGIAEKDGVFLLIAYIGSILYGFFLISLARDVVNWLF